VARARRSGEAAPRSPAAVYSPPTVASSSRPGWSSVRGVLPLGALSAHVAYLERDGVTRDGEKGCMFGATEDRTDAWPSRDAASTTGIIFASSSRRRMPPR
jgi:hypothetical protein